MKILHYGSLNALDGGPALSTHNSIAGIKALGHSCDLVSMPLPPGGRNLADDVTIHYTPEPLSRGLGYVKNIQKFFAGLPEADIYHIQGLWQLAGHDLCRFAAKSGKPYIITLRGMLYPQAYYNRSFLKKFAAMVLYQRRDLQMANCIQVTCDEELKHYRDFGVTNPVAVIPNGLALPEIMPEVQCRGDIFEIGYLGRLHPRKYVERILYALASLRMNNLNCRLHIIGSGDDNYEKFLRNETERLGLKNVIFEGFLTGNAKTDMIKKLSVLAVPSNFENFGNIIPEALAYGVPVIASTGTPWQDLETYNCGWWVNNSVDTLTDTLLEAQKLSPEDLAAMGRNGQILLQEKYSLEKTSKMLEQLYLWLLGDISRPEFIVP